MLRPRLPRSFSPLPPPRAYVAPPCPLPQPLCTFHHARSPLRYHSAPWEAIGAMCCRYHHCHQYRRPLLPFDCRLGGGADMTMLMTRKMVMTTRTCITMMMTTMAMRMMTRMTTMTRNHDARGAGAGPFPRTTWARQRLGRKCRFHPPSDFVLACVCRNRFRRPSWPEFSSSASEPALQLIHRSTQIPRTLPRAMRSTRTLPMP